MEKKAGQAAVFAIILAIVVGTIGAGLEYLGAANSTSSNNTANTASTAAVVAQPAIATTTVVVQTTTIQTLAATAIPAQPSQPAPAAVFAPTQPVQPTPISTLASSAPQLTPTSTVPFPATTTALMSTTTVATVTATTTTTTATSSAAIQLPYSVGTFGDSFSANDGWTDWQGTTSETGGLLTVGSSDSTSGGALLSGSNWSNYIFSATLDWNEGEAIGIVGRYVDNGDYVVCNFIQSTPGYMHLTIHQLVGGQDTDLADGEIPNYNGTGGSNINVALSLQGNQATCAFNGYSVATLFAGTTLTGPSSGEIGFNTWDPTAGASQIAVHTVGVTTDVYNIGSNNVQVTN